MESAVTQVYPSALVTLVPSSGGIFEVKADSKIIFSSRRVNRAPKDADEVVKVMLERFPTDAQPNS